MRIKYPIPFVYAGLTLMVIVAGCKTAKHQMSPVEQSPSQSARLATKEPLSAAQSQLLAEPPGSSAGLDRGDSIAIAAAAADEPGLVGPAADQCRSIRVVTWNVKAVLSIEEVIARRAHFERAGRELRPDILVIQEVGSQSVAMAVARAMGLQDFHVVCSDFNQDDLPDYANLEVAIISRFSLDSVIEFDQFPDNVAGDPPEAILGAPSLPGLAQADMPRGFLWARIDSIRFTVATTHLKSARGKHGVEDYESSRKREYVAASMAAGVNEDRRLYPTYSCVVAGDLNVAHADDRKNGMDLMRDHPGDANADDGYDETHALFGGGLVDGLRMRNLSLDIRTSSNPSFPQNSPIDNIYMASDEPESMSMAWLCSDLFGSDHLPVVVDLQVRN